MSTCSLRRRSYEFTGISNVWKYIGDQNRARIEPWALSKVSHTKIRSTHNGVLHQAECVQKFVCISVEDQHIADWIMRHGFCALVNTSPCHYIIF